MSTTKYLNSQRTVWVTTWFGGPDRGTCFDISVQLDDETQATATYRTEDLADLVRVNGDIRGLAKPVLDTLPPNADDVYPVEVNGQMVFCLSDVCQGREDRCGLFSVPSRCSPGNCSAPIR